MPTHSATFQSDRPSIACARNAESANAPVISAARSIVGVAATVQRATACDAPHSRLVQAGTSQLRALPRVLLRCRLPLERFPEDPLNRAVARAPSLSTAAENCPPNQKESPSR